MEPNYDMKGFYCEVGDGKILEAMNKYLLATGLDMAMVNFLCYFCLYLFYPYIAPLKPCIFNYGQRIVNFGTIAIQNLFCLFEDSGMFKLHLTKLVLCISIFNYELKCISRSTLSSFFYFIKIYLLLI
jgi:hypothetical protein